MKTKESIWVILDSNGNFCAFGSKIAWVTSGAAKNAFNCHISRWKDGYRINVKIEDCPEYKLVEIKA